MPPGLRQLETLLFSVGRITQMLEMNFEVLQHFLGSLVALVERVRALYGDAAQLSSRMCRQSLEFGATGMSTVRSAHSRVRRHPLASLGFIAAVLSILLRLRRSLASKRRLLGRGGAAVLGDAFATAALDGAWR